MFAHSLLVVLMLALVYAQDRKITSELNPGCKSCSTNNTLLYIQAQGSHDTVHQIWDFTRGAPTVIFVVADINSTLQISWNDTEPVKFSMTETPQYSFAIVIDKLYEYNDLEDNGHIDKKYPQHSYSLRDLPWQLKDQILTEQETMIRVHGQLQKKGRSGISGIIDIKLDLLPFKDYAVELPHLIHTANSTLVDVSLVNLTTSRGFNASRFAIHFLLTSVDRQTDTMHYTMRKSLDDEHTPGVFEIIEILTPSSYNGDSGGFLQFRPVGYTQPERGVTSSTMAHVSNFNRTSLPHSSTAHVFYRNLYQDAPLVQDIFVSFGDTGDGFYREHNYTSWSFTVGYGSPPIESFSLFVIVIISIGLGVPVLLALSGITYVLVRRYKQRNTPTRFTDDE